jgi:uncharacterized membrane protein
MAEDARSASVRTFLLVSSLCLNLILLGLLLVSVGRVVQGGFIAQPGGPLAPGQIMRSLPPDQAEKVRAIQRQHQPALRDARQGARRARLAAFRLFAGPDYSPGAFAAALEDVRAADAKLEAEAIALSRDVIGSLTPEERRMIVGRIRSGANRPWLRRMLRPNPPAPN